MSDEIKKPVDPRELGPKRPSSLALATATRIVKEEVDGLKRIAKIHNAAYSFPNPLGINSYTEAIAGLTDTMLQDRTYILTDDDLQNAFMALHTYDDSAELGSALSASVNQGRKSLLANPALLNIIDQATAIGKRWICPQNRCYLMTFYMQKLWQGQCIPQILSDTN